MMMIHLLFVFEHHHLIVSTYLDVEPKTKLRRPLDLAMVLDIPLFEATGTLQLNPRVPEPAWEIFSTSIR